MKREVKNQLSRRKILDSACEEFGNHGYGLSSVNSICAKGNISKGIIYHYFKDKDELYLECIKELFIALTEHLQEALIQTQENHEEQLKTYFEARLSFFHEYPLYHKLFCDTIIAPPHHLADKIQLLRTSFDKLNMAILKNLLKDVKLRSDVTIESAVETFRLFQDFMNANYQVNFHERINLEEHEQACQHSLSILLYGIIERSL